MRTIKANLPEGVKKKFDIRVGKKVKLINKEYADRKKRKEMAKAQKNK